MFTVSLPDLTGILADFGVQAPAAAFSELQRYHYEDSDPDSREVRLIVKVAPENEKPLVVRFKNESDVTLDLVEAQSRFAALLRQNGVETPRLLQTEGSFARWYALGGYDVIVTAEQFVAGELRVVDEAVAEETGALLAETHSIAERADFHVQNPVLFDPLRDNDLFDRSLFSENAERLRAVDAPLCAKIESTPESAWQRSPLYRMRAALPYRETSATATCIARRAAGSACSTSTAAATTCSISTPSCRPFSRRA